MKTEDAISEYIEGCAYRNLSPSTIRTYRWALGRLLEHGDDLPTSARDVQQILASPDASDDTRHDLWRATKTFYRWLEHTHGERNLMAHVPAPKVRPKFPRTLSVDEITELLYAAASPRDLALVAVLLDTGASVGEVAGLKRADLSCEGIQIFGKTGARFVPMSPDLLDSLGDIGDENHIWIGARGPLTVHGLSLAVRRTMYKARLTPPKSGPHTLRHTFALRFIRKGGSLPVLQRLLGHATVQSTMIYAKMSDRDLIEQHRQYSPTRGLGIQRHLRRVKGRPRAIS